MNCKLCKRKLKDEGHSIYNTKRAVQYQSIRIPDFKSKKGDLFNHYHCNICRFCLCNILEQVGREQMYIAESLNMEYWGVRKK